MKSVAILFAIACVAIANTQDIPKDYADAAAYLGRTGDYKANVFKIGLPRNDLKITIQGNAIPTPFGFAGWIAMTKGDGGHDVMMGDLPVLEEELNPVLSAVLDNGLEATAIHNHFFYMNQNLYFMHIHGHGTAMDLAKAIKPALDLIGKSTTKYEDRENSEIGPEGHQPPQTLVAGPLDIAALDKIVGATADKNGDCYKYTIGRPDLHIVEMGATINARMGLNTWSSFYGSDKDAVFAGDVAMLADEVQGVLKTLRSRNVEVVAMHHHMIGTDPQIIFLHYWGRGPAAELATTLRMVLDQLGKKP